MKTTSTILILFALLAVKTFAQNFPNTSLSFPRLTADQDIRCVAYGWADNKPILASGGTEPNIIRLWWANSGAPFDLLSGHDGDVNSIAFSPDNEWIASGSDDGTLRLWKYTLGKARFFHWADAGTWQEDPDQTISFDEHLFGRKWLPVINPFDNNVKSVAFGHLKRDDQDITMLACGTRGGKVVVWRYDSTAKEWSNRRDLAGHEEAVNSVAFSPDGPSADFIKEAARGENFIYFVLSAQFPTLQLPSPNGIDDVSPIYKEYAIALDLQDPDGSLQDPGYFMFPVKTPLTKLKEKGEQLVKEAAKKAAKKVFVKLRSAIPIVSEIIKWTDIIWEIGNSIYEIKSIFESAANPEITLTSQELGFESAAKPDPIEFLFLVTQPKEHVDINIELQYRLLIDQSPLAPVYWNYKITYIGTWDMEEDALAAPGVQLTSLSDYPLFHLLPPEVQEYLLRHFGQPMNAMDWQIPEVTALLPNYPNPFNPETWIPYQLSEPTNVTLTIYDIQGRVVRALDLGHQRAGIYHRRSRAAYWDGRNAVGESVASGLYFYTLKAGDFSATRKMLIRK